MSTNQSSTSAAETGFQSNQAVTSHDAPIVTDCSNSNINNNDNNSNNNNNNNDDDDNEGDQRFFFCHACGAFRREKRDMNNHWRTEHGWSQKKRDALQKQWEDPQTVAQKWGPYTKQEARILAKDRNNFVGRYGRNWKTQLRLRNCRQQFALRDAIVRDPGRAEALARFREWAAGDDEHLDTDDGEDWAGFSPAHASDLDLE